MACLRSEDRHKDRHRLDTGLASDQSAEWEKFRKVTTQRQSRSVLDLLGELGL